MGAYNVVHTTITCPSCQRAHLVAIQFKFGDTYQHGYVLGDKVRWGGNDVGEPGKAHVVVDGIAEAPCPHCGYGADLDFYLHVEMDQLVRVEVADGKYDFIDSDATFVVVLD